MNTERWQGVYPAVTTKFKPDSSLDIGPKFVQQIKLVEELMGVGSATVRSPGLALSEPEADHVRQVLEQALANRPVV